MNARRDREGLGRDNETWIGELGQRAIASWVAEKSKCGVVTVEDILHRKEELDAVRQSIFRARVEDRVPGKRLLKIGLVATKKLR